MARATIDNREIPDRLMDAVAAVFGRAVEIGHKSTRGRSAPTRNAAIRAAVSVVGQLRDAAAAAEASGLASWAEVKDLPDPPSDPIAASLWIVARCCKIVSYLSSARDVDKTTLREIKDGLTSWAVAAKAEPLESRVQAWAAIRAGRASEKQASGPATSPRPEARRSRRSLSN